MQTISQFTTFSCKQSQEHPFGPAYVGAILTCLSFIFAVLTYIAMYHRREKILERLKSPSMQSSLEFVGFGFPTCTTASLMLTFLNEMRGEKKAYVVPDPVMYFIFGLALILATIAITFVVFINITFIYKTTRHFIREHKLRDEEQDYNSLELETISNLSSDLSSDAPEQREFVVKKTTSPVDKIQKLKSS